MKNILILLLFNINCFSQNVTLENNGGLRIIFSANEDFKINNLKADNLKESEIKNLEKELYKLTSQKQSEFKQFFPENIEDENWANMDMKNYIRQYSGFLNLNNEKIIFINFLSKEDLEKENMDYKSKWILNLPCCKSYMMTYYPKKKTFSDVNFLKL